MSFWSGTKCAQWTDWDHDEWWSEHDNCDKHLHGSAPAIEVESWKHMVHYYFMVTRNVCENFSDLIRNDGDSSFIKLWLAISWNIIFDIWTLRNPSESKTKHIALQVGVLIDTDGKNILCDPFLYIMIGMRVRTNKKVWNSTYEWHHD